jgi:hypothetical protein
LKYSCRLLIVAAKSLKFVKSCETALLRIVVW